MYWWWFVRDFYRLTPEATVREEAAPAVTIIEDDTKPQTLEEALVATQSALRLSERGKSSFLSSMNHELRTPLNAIMGFAEMMKSEVFGPLENENYAEYAEHIHDSGKDLLSKINDLIEIANVDAGTLALAESNMPLLPVLEEVIEIHSHDAFARQIQLRIDCPHAIELMADRTKILCALSHFLNNAIRHSKSKSEITLAARVTRDDGLVLSVRDAGEGIAPKQLTNIRAALQSDACYLNIASGGIGLGLALARELAVRHGGRIMLDSIRHKGTVVSIILPPARVLRGLPAKKQRRL